MMNHYRLRWPGGLNRAFTLSYDDGCREDMILAEMMEKYGVKGTFNIIWNSLWPEDRPDPEKNPIRRNMRHSEFQEFIRRYEGQIEIANHTLTHPVLQTLTPGQRSYDLIAGRRELEKATGKLVRGFAFSMSHTDADLAMEQVRLSGVAYVRTYNKKRDFAFSMDDPLALPSTCHHTIPEEELQCLADEFLAYPDARKKDCALFFVWGHTYEFTNNNDWDKMERLLQKVGNREDVWYATCIEIADYVRAYRSLEFSVEGDRVYNPSAIPVYLKVFTDADEGKLYCIKPGTETPLS
ncbi:MAG: polysaccharide deacetylase family protein [Lachnospiraceae bacterium]|nr:polysaccharide deacetylase family protein [Lachnospiraceae bacterium]